MTLCYHLCLHHSTDSYRINQTHIYTAFFSLIPIILLRPISSISLLQAFRSIVSFPDLRFFQCCTPSTIALVPYYICMTLYLFLFVLMEPAKRVDCFDFCFSLPPLLLGLLLTRGSLPAVWLLQLLCWREDRDASSCNLATAS